MMNYRRVRDGAPYFSESVDAHALAFALTAVSLVAGLAAAVLAGVVR